MHYYLERGRKSHLQTEPHEKLEMFEAMRQSVMRDLESASVSNLDLPFTDMCQRRAGNKPRRHAPLHVDHMVRLTSDVVINLPLE